ncbi:MAG TPA: DUF177 domain-containing protein [Thermoanaerobaculia bacterium]|nr:DUF177 domain-containing protein [Thermoanaerobaculia bacterium]
MYISLDQVRVAPVRWDETLEIPAGSLDAPELLDLSPVRCRGTASFVDPGFHFHATLGYVQRLQCDRCLEPFDQQVDLDLHLVLQQAGDADGGEDASSDGEPSDELGRLEEDELGVVRILGDEVSTEPLVTEQVVLNLPMKPLCRPDCAGLCPTCGADLNAARCECAPPGDSRWADLEAFLHRHGAPRR